MNDQEARDGVARVETLLGELESLSDPVARERANETVGAVLELYGEGLERIVAQLAQRDVDGRLAEALTDDELVSHLLLLHGLHPVSLEARVLGALEEVRPYMDSHGGGVELLGVEDGIVRLRMQGSCDGCPSSAMTLKLAIEDAIHKVAPDVEGIEAEGAVPEPAPPTLLQIGVVDPLEAGNGPEPDPEPDGSWAMIGGLPQLASGGTIVKEVAGEPVLLLKLDGNAYAYRPACPGCEASLEEAALEGGDLVCPGCGNRYDARRAGRCLDQPQLNIEPVPLLEDDAGLVKIALRAAVA